MDQLRALRYFSKLAETLSFSETADYFRVPSSSVSRRIKDLEETLGVELFLRTTRSVSLTDLGVLYLTEIKTALQTIDIADEMCKAQSISPSGTVRITAMPGYAELYVLPAIDQMRTIYPDLEFDLNITDQTLSLSSNDADIAIRATSDLPDQVVARRLSKHNFILVASPDFINQNGRPQTSDDLCRFPVFMYRTPHGVLNWQAQKNQTWKDIELTPKYVSNNGQSLLESVVGGQGIALLPSWGVEKEISTGQLEKIELEDGRLSTNGDIKMSIYLLYHPPKFQLKKIRLTIDFLYKELNLLRKITT